MLTCATRGRLWAASWLLGWLSLGFVSCSPDSFLVSDEDRDRNYQRALAAERVRDYEGAAEYYERALDRNPRASNVHLSYAALCEGQLGRFAEAVHHYQRYLRLNPADPKAEDIRRRVTNCTERLATSVPVVIRSETIARDLDAMRRENLALRAQVTNWVAVGTAWSNEVRRLTQELTLANAASSAAATSVPTRSGTVSPGQGSAPRGTTPGVGTPTPRTATTPGRAYTPGTRFYRIAAGDTLASIARRHGLSVGALRSANPTLNDRRLLPGTIVRIPVR